ncbi:radical SAM protein [Pseudodesulfovibrio cashew]|nr:radical SAM protein [Pseudodesulfovibrio cashew]
MNKRSLSDIPKGSRVAIYGAGESGQKIMMILQEFRPDVSIRCFLDTYKSDTFHDLPCIRVDDLSTVLDSIDLIVVASAFYPEITSTLRLRGVSNYLVIDRSFYRLPFSTREELRAMSAMIEQCEKRSSHPAATMLDEYIRKVEWDLSELKAYQDTGFLPHGAMVQISKKCNLRCVFCGHEAWKENTGFMDFELLQKVVEEINAIGANMTLVGPQGEPTLHPEFEKIIRYVGKHVPRALLCTNGTALTPSKIEAIVDSGLTSVEISFAGYDAKSYESIYVGADFEKTTRNMQQLSDAIQASGKDISLVIKGIYPYSWNQEDDFESFKAKCFALYERLGIKGRYDISGEPHNFAGNVESGPYDEQLKLFTTKTIANSRPRLCGQLFNPCVHHDGKVSVCGCHDANCRMPIGKIGQESFAAMMQGEQMKEYVISYMERRYDKIPLCRKCDVPYK